MLKAKFKLNNFYFNFPGVTSRGILTQKPSWFLKIWQSEHPEKFGIGEISIIPLLSPETPEIVEQALLLFCQNPKAYLDNFSNHKLPAVKFGIETALLDLENGGNRILLDSEFTKGQNGIKINGLIWMGEKNQMIARINEKIKQGFSCLKLKVGAINFDDELDLLKLIRKNFSHNTLELRIDANGAFSPENALDKIEKLSPYHIHSIEQPIKHGQWTEMAQLCKKTSIAIALDEELIGINDYNFKEYLLQQIKPQYIILKPSLIGGLNETLEWTKVAENQNIKWWVTSALESNIGLNAIAQWTYLNGSNMPQGLGTGQVFSNNIASPLSIKGEQLWHDNSRHWDDIDFGENTSNNLNTKINVYLDTQNISTDSTSKIKYEIKLNNHIYDINTANWDNFLREKQSKFWSDIVDFLKNWANKINTIKLQTSGSTGAAKTIEIEKEKLWISASKTCDFFKLNQESTGLLCLSANYIAGKMMLVRAMVSGMNLWCVEPSNKPLSNFNTTVNFAAMVPSQVRESLNSGQLSQIENLIIGGGQVAQDIVHKLSTTKIKAFETFGMTETLSHIALRQLSPALQMHFTLLRGVRIFQDKNGEMVIDYPELGLNKLKTNDIIELLDASGKFIWKGRTDFIINSGGIKISPEEIENQIAHLISQPFCIIGVPDEKLGEKVGLVIEGKAIDTEAIMLKLRKSLSPYHLPKLIKFVDKIPLTDSGKIQRKKIFET